MSRRGASVAYYALCILTLIAAVIAGAFLAVDHHHDAAHRPARRGARPPRARTIAARPAHGAHAEPVATVLPPADAGPPAPVWPPPLLNPSANLRMAWDLSLGRPNAHEILFTFDDGPNPGTTDRLLRILDHAHIKAAFFVCGWRLEDEEPLRSRTRALLREEFEQGHVIGNHTIHHYNMATLSPQQIQREIDHNADLIQEVTGQRPHLFRPPYGSYSEHVRAHVEERGDELTLWSIDSHDWQMVGDAQGVAMNVIRLIGNMAGGTILLHDTHPWSVTAAQMVIRWIETENRERATNGREPYRVLDAAQFIEGERARIPLIEAERAAAAQQARHGRRDGGAADASASENESAGNAGMGAAHP